MPDLSSLLLMAAVFAVAYLLFIRPQQRRQAEQQKTTNALVPGTRVMTTSGVYATVRHVGERQIIVEISPGVDMTIVKAAIAKVVKPEDDEFEYDDEPTTADDEPTTADEVGEVDEPDADSDGPYAPYPQNPVDGDAGSAVSPAGDPKN